MPARKRTAAPPNVVHEPAVPTEPDPIPIRPEPDPEPLEPEAKIEPEDPKAPEPNK